MTSDVTFNLIVKARDRTLYEGRVISVTSFNAKGRFDILARHANFISLIINAIIIREPKGSLRELRIKSGLLRTKNDQVEIYVGVEQIMLPQSDTQTPQVSVS